MGPDSWPLWLRWVLLVVVGCLFIGSSWWLALKQASNEGDEAPSWRAQLRNYGKSLGFGEWATLALLVIFLIPLLIETVAKL